MCEETNTNIDEFDVLRRKKIVNDCINLIYATFISTKSAFIMIDGGWGEGKTFMMNMLNKKLKDMYTVIKYNCWENSYYNDPLEAILSIMLDYIERDKLWTDTDIKKIKILFKLILVMLSFGTFKVETKYKDNFNELKQGIKDNITLGQSINIYSAINEVKLFLKSNNERIIVLVDEIDRCLPEYGIKTLERLYLLFKDMPNIVVVIANDKSKMETSIQNAFGYKSIDNYLEKFIDYTMKIDRAKIHFSNKDFIKKYSYYLKNFSIYNMLLDTDLSDNEFWRLFDFLFFDKNMRYIDHAMKKAYKIHMLAFNDYTPYKKGIDYLDNRIPNHILMAELLIVELKEISLNIAFAIATENYAYVKKNFKPLYNYIKRTESRYKSVFKMLQMHGEQMPGSSYKCIWYLAHIAKNKNDDLNIGYFDLDLKSDEDWFETLYRLDDFYDFSLTIE